MSSSPANTRMCGRVDLGCQVASYALGVHAISANEVFIHREDWNSIGVFPPEFGVGIDIDYFDLVGEVAQYGRQVEHEIIAKTATDPQIHPPLRHSGRAV